MHEWSTDTVGIQEARDRHDSQWSGQHFEVFAEAAAQGHGVQLWLHKKLGIPANRVRVTSSSNRHLLAAIRCPSLRLDVLVGHALVKDGHGKQETWWREITPMVRGRHQSRAELLALADATCRVGSISSLEVGLSSHRRRMLDFLGKCEFFACQHLGWSWTAHLGASDGSRCCVERGRQTSPLPSQTTDQCLRILLCVKIAG